MHFQFKSIYLFISINRRLDREVDIMTQLSHVNIARVFGAAETNTQLLLVLEYASHGSVVGFIKECADYQPRIHIPMTLLMKFCVDFAKGMLIALQSHIL
jgi:serine/threonine protein kinase